MARRATRGDSAQFTYDFGIAIAQSTVNKVTRLTGVTLSLASAFYALKTTASEYVDTLRENTLRFGGVLSTMKAMQQAQDRLITGMSRFDVRDQMSGMNQLMAAGVDVKKNMAWIEKAAHATGKSFDQFSGMIANAVRGNLQGLVDAGLMTQRSTKAFEKFQGNTRMMQGAVINFLRTHKGLMSAIKNDFTTIEDGVRRLKAVMTSFLQSVIGKPNDPDSLYGSVARVFNMIADKFGKDGVLTQNMIMLRQYGEGVGIVMSWMVRKVGEVMIWLGRQAKKAMIFLLGDSETFAERMRSLVVWLEFWKLKIVDIFKTVTGAIRTFYKEHEGLIKAIGKVFLAYLAWGVAWKVITKGTLMLQGMIFACRALRKAIIAAGGAWAFFSKGMTVAMFKGAGSRSFFRLFGLTPYGVGAWFRQLGESAAVAFSAGFSAVKGLLTKTWGLTLAAMGSSFSVVCRNIFKPLMLLWNGFVTAIVKWFKFSYLLWNKPMGAIKMIGNGVRFLLGVFGKFFKFLIGGFRFIINLVLNLPKFIGVLKNGLQALFAVFGVSNPVGWIITAIVLLGTLYVKCKTIRVFLNNLFKFLWEAIKLVWNLIYGAFVYVVYGLKKIWQFLKNYIFLPVANFFKAAWGWIKDMWKAFMNTAVGRFIDKYIVSPIRTLFDWMLKAWNWIVKAMAKAVEWISGANSDLAKNLNSMAAENGLPKLAASGGKYDTKDDTNYLNPNNWGIDSMTPKGGGGESPTLKNPLLSTPTGSSGIGGGGGGTTNNISLSNGAVQIIVPKGTNIDEAKLAKMVRDEIRNLDRENRMRGGDI